MVGPAAALTSAIAAAFGNVSPVIEYAGLESAFTEAFAAGAAVPTAANSDVPKAYLQYIVFDKEMRMARHGYQMVTRESLGNWEKLRLEVPVRENGYIYIYVANESKANVDVFFDDIEVQMIDAPATSANDYYPFGLTMKNRSYTSEDYRFGYQGQPARRSNAEEGSPRWMRRQDGMRLRLGCGTPRLGDGSILIQVVSFGVLTLGWGIVL